MAKRKKSSKSEPKQKGVALVPTWKLPDNLPSNFVNQMIITNTGGAEFYILFGEAEPPFFLYEPAKEPIGDDLQKLEVEPRVKITVTLEHLERFLDVIQKHIKNSPVYAKRTLPAAGDGKEES